MAYCFLVLKEAVRARDIDVVPVGLGVVVPADKILELLEIEPLREHRERIARSVAAQPTSVAKPSIAEPERPATEGDDKHRERFTALLDEAVGKPKPAR